LKIKSKSKIKMTKINEKQYDLDERTFEFAKKIRTFGKKI